MIDPASSAAKRKEKLELGIKNAFRLNAHTATLLEEEIGIRMRKAAGKRPASWLPNNLAGTQEANGDRKNVLQIVTEEAPISVRGIADILSLAPAKVSNHIRILKELGLIEPAGVAQERGVIKAQLYRRVNQ